MRFMNTIREVSPAQLVRLTQIDYDREMAFVATIEVDGAEKEVGVVRYATSPDGPWSEIAEIDAADFAIQALCGLMSITGPPEGPPYKVGVALADILTGLYATTTILAALHARTRMGR